MQRRRERLNREGILEIVSNMDLIKKGIELQSGPQGEEEIKKGAVLTGFMSCGISAKNPIPIPTFCLASECTCVWSVYCGDCKMSPLGNPTNGESHKKMGEGHHMRALNFLPSCEKYCSNNY